MSSLDRSDRGGRSALAGQQLHSNAANDKVHLEWSRGDRYGFVAFERFWTFSFVRQHPHWKVSEPE